MWIHFLSASGSPRIILRDLLKKRKRFLFLVYASLTDGENKMFSRLLQLFFVTIAV